MPTRSIRRNTAAQGSANAAVVPIYVDSDDNILKMIPAGSGTTEVQIADESSVQTFTNKTLTAPTLTAVTITGTSTIGAGMTITSPTISGVVTSTNPQITGDASSGIVVAKTMTFIEDATSTSYVGTVVIPAGATLLDILISNPAYWAASAASLKVGDTASDSGFFAAINVKATDIVPGEVISVSGSTGNWGGENGAYLVAATGVRGPASTNFGCNYIAASTIIATIAVTTPTTGTGKTIVTVFYAVGQAVTIVKT